MTRSPVIRASKMCIYCGKPVGRVRKGEHIVPEALGGKATIKTVCAKCNNAVSLLDKEFASESPVALIAWEELGETSPDTWNYNPKLDLVLEGRMLPNHTSHGLWPQVVFDRGDRLFIADLQELCAVGPKRYFRKFVRCLIKARRTVDSGDPLWIWRRVTRAPRRGRFPPRVYARHTYDELSDRIHFVCKYLDRRDRERVLSSLDMWDPLGKGLELDEGIGIIDPEGLWCYQPRRVLRALVKIGINLLSHICKRTSVNKYTFTSAVAFVLDDHGRGSSMADSGFVRNEGAQAMGCPKRAHKFHLSYGRNWALDCAFFGARIGATVAFPGPNHEWWRRAEITMPLGEPALQIQTSRILVPRSGMCVEWSDMRKVIPSVPLTKSDCQFRIEPAR